MRMKMVSVGEPDKNGEREFTFQVLVNKSPVLYQVRATHENDAANNLSRFVEGDAARMQELGAGDTGATIVLLGAVAAVSYLVVRHLKTARKPAASTPPTRKARPNNGIEVSRADFADSDDSGDADGAPDDAGFSVTSARSSSPFTPRSFNQTRGGATGARGSALGSRGATASGEIIDAAVTSWRPLTYHGAQGKLAGDATTQALRIVVFSDLPPDPFLALARPSSYDGARGTLQDAIAVLAFPIAAADSVRSPGAVEVMIGGNPSREFDITAASADEALSSVRTLLARHL